MSVQSRHHALTNHGTPRAGDAAISAELPQPVADTEGAGGPVCYLFKETQNRQHHPRIHGTSSVLLPMCEAAQEEEGKMSRVSAEN